MEEDSSGDESSAKRTAKEIRVAHATTLPPSGHVISVQLQKGLTLAAYGENTKNEVDNDAVLTVETFIGEKSTLCSGLYEVSSFDAESEQISLSLPRLFNDNSVFCARVPGSDAGTCPGDSGGTLLQTPFIEKIKDSRSILRGVVHGSIAPCDGSRFPSIFVRIDNHDILTWIAEKVFHRQKLKITKKKKGG